jgi:hypothetical protein
MKVITMKNLNSCIFSFVSFSSTAVMLMPRGTPYIKQKIAGQEFLSPDDLLEAIREEYDRPSKSVLESVFDEWLIRLQTYIDYQGSYFPEG